MSKEVLGAVLNKQRLGLDRTNRADRANNRKVLVGGNKRMRMK